MVAYVWGSRTVLSGCLVLVDSRFQASSTRYETRDNRRGQGAGSRGKDQGTREEQRSSFGLDWTGLEWTLERQELVNSLIG